MEDRPKRTACRPVSRSDVLTGLAGNPVLRTDTAPRLVEQRSARVAPGSLGLAPTAFQRPQRRMPHCGLADLTRHLIPIVKALLSGQTDETASRKLGISPRTYSRRVAELLEYLQVSTRFQGGAELIRRCQPGCQHLELTEPQFRRAE